MLNKIHRIFKLNFLFLIVNYFVNKFLSCFAKFLYMANKPHFEINTNMIIIKSNNHYYDCRHYVTIL